MDLFEVINTIHQRRQGIDMVAMEYELSTAYCKPDKPLIEAHSFWNEDEPIVAAASVGRQEGRGEPNGAESQITTAR